MKREILAWAGVALLCVAPACASIEDQPPAGREMEVAALVLQRSELEATLAEPLSPESRANVEAELAAVEAQLTAIEVQRNQATASTIGGLVSTVNPAVGAGIAAVGALVAPLFGKRGRKHGADAVKAIVPWNGSVSIGDALSAVGKMVGAKHSSEASEKAAEDAPPS